MGDKYKRSLDESGAQSAPSNILFAPLLRSKSLKLTLPTLPKEKYLNDRTFLETPVDKIPEECRFSSNQYIYDINELAQYIYYKHDFVRPYPPPPADPEFFTQDEIKELLKNNVILKVLDQWENQLIEQSRWDLKSKISPCVMKQLFNDAKTIWGDEGKENPENPKEKFYKEAQKALDNIKKILSQLNPGVRYQLLNYTTSDGGFGSGRETYTLQNCINELDSMACVHVTGHCMTIVLTDIENGNTSQEAIEKIHKLRQLTKPRLTP